MKNFRLIVTLIFSLSTGIISNAQVAIGVETPHESAQLDVTSTTKGLLIPRMTGEERSLITGTEGLLVYQTDYPVGFYYFTNAQWVKLVNEKENPNGMYFTRYNGIILTIKVSDNIFPVSIFNSGAYSRPFFTRTEVSSEELEEWDAQHPFKESTIVVLDPGYYQVIYSLDFEFTSSSEEVELTTCVMSPSNPDVSTEFSEHPYSIVRNTYKGSGTVMVSFIFEAQKKT